MKIQCFLLGFLVHAIYIRLSIGYYSDIIFPIIIATLIGTAVIIDYFSINKKSG